MTSLLTSLHCILMQPVLRAPAPRQCPASSALGAIYRIYSMRRSRHTRLVWRVLLSTWQCQTNEGLPMLPSSAACQPDPGMNITHVAPNGDGSRVQAHLLYYERRGWLWGAARQDAQGGPLCTTGGTNCRQGAGDRICSPLS